MVPALHCVGTRPWDEAGSAFEENKLKIYVGNLPYSCSSEELQEMFEQHGRVGEATVIMDRETGRSKGFGFVDMPNDSEANEAVNALNASQMGGRSLRVSEARPRTNRGGDRGDRGGDRGDRRGGGGGWR